MSYNQQQQQSFSWNTQQQNVFPQQPNSNQTLTNFDDFPSISQPTSQGGSQAPASDFPAFNMGGGDFNAGASEFVPTGVVAGKEEFTSFDEAFGDSKASKKKKQQPTKAQLDKEKLEAQMALPTKGKSSDFFAHQGTLSQE